MMTNAAHQILVKHFHAFQIESSGVDHHLRHLQSDLKELDLCTELDSLSIDASRKAHASARTTGTSTTSTSRDADNDAAIHPLISDSLLTCIHCIFVSETPPPVVVDNDNSDSLFDLMAAIAQAYNLFDTACTFFTVLHPASVATVDRIRLLACRMIMACIKQAPQHMHTHTVDQLIPLLLPRLLDKAQSVRLAAIQACHFISEPTQQHHLIITESLLWNVHHDPSTSNRCAALRSIPITADSIHHIIRRLRDVKPKVRVTAMKRLYTIPIDKLTPHQCAAIVRAGITDRCKETNDATTILLCTRWIKAAKYDPIVLLSFMNPSLYEPECEKVITTLLQVSSDLLKDLSDAEIHAFRQGMDRQSKVETLLPPNLLLARLQCEHETVPAKRMDRIQTIVPDIPVLCDTIQSCIDTLAHEIDDDSIFCCIQLFNLVQLMDLHEEGSRRHFIASCKSILASHETPEDILEEAVKAMGRAHDHEDKYLLCVAEIIETMTDRLRIVSILTLVLENTSPRMTAHSVIQGFVQHVVPALCDTDLMIREAAVGCLGRLALLSDEEAVLADFKPLLLNIASQPTETLEIRAQAILALCDLTTLFDDMLLPIEVNGEKLGFSDTVSDMLQNTNPSVVAVATEVAAKLLFSGKVQNDNLLASLLVIFFDKKYHHDVNDDDDDTYQQEENEVGNLYRMQQILSLFFPAYIQKGFPLIPAIGPMLMATATKKRGRKAFPISKMIEYIYSTSEEGMQKLIMNKDIGPADTTATIINNALLVCLEVVIFLLSHHDNLSIINLRILCKLLGGADVDLDQCLNVELLISLKEKVNELTMLLSDQTSIESLETIVELLEDVQAEEGDNKEEEDHGTTASKNVDDMTDILNSMTVKENEFIPIQTTKKNYESSKVRTRQAFKIAN